MCTFLFRMCVWTRRSQFAQFWRRNCDKNLKFFSHIPKLFTSGHAENNFDNPAEILCQVSKFFPENIRKLKMKLRINPKYSFLRKVTLQTYVAVSTTIVQKICQKPKNYSIAEKTLQPFFAGFSLFQWSLDKWTAVLLKITRKFFESFGPKTEKKKGTCRNFLIVKVTLWKSRLQFRQWCLNFFCQNSENFSARCP